MVNFTVQFATKKMKLSLLHFKNWMQSQMLMRTFTGWSVVQYQILD